MQLAGGVRRYLIMQPDAKARRGHDPVDRAVDLTIAALDVIVGRVRQQGLRLVTLP